MRESLLRSIRIELMKAVVHQCRLQQSGWRSSCGLSSGAEAGVQVCRSFHISIENLMG